MASEQNLKNKIIGSLIWKFLERGGVQIVQFVVSIVIARILDPDDYGIIAIVMVFTTLATVFVQSGLGTAIIQKKEIRSIELSSVFYYSLGISLVLYIVLYISSPLISEFYKMPQLTSSLRVMSLLLFPGAYNSVQNALVAKEMKFRVQFISSMIAAVISGAIGITLAKYNMGVWALVWQQLSYQTIICLILMIFIKWHPEFEFSFKQTLNLLKYGVKILGARLVDTIFHNIENLIIGKKYNSETLALYSKGKQFPLIIIDNLDGSIQSVMLPAYVRNQDDIGKLRSSVRQTISLSTYIVFPAMAGLAAVAYPLILLVLGEKWLGCVPFLQIYCLTSALFPFQTANLQAFNAIGRSDAYFLIMTVKRIIATIILCVAVFCFQSVLAIVWATALFEIVGIIITMVGNIRLLQYSIKDLLKDTLPNMFMAAVMFLLANLLTFLPVPSMGLICLQIMTGIIVYVGLSIITKNKNFFALIKTLKNAKLKKETKQ